MWCTPNNMVLDRDTVIKLFDEGVGVAEDNDLCWRWLSAGRTIRYEPDLVVTHHDWRTTGEIERAGSASDDHRASV